MRQTRLIGFLSIISAITVCLPDRISAYKRCPENGTTDYPTVKTYADENFCNIYHECNCTRTKCHIVESQVCPIAKVYSKIKETCLDIEEQSCDTTYVQWVQTHSSYVENHNEKISKLISNSHMLLSSNQDFQCKKDQPGKFSDPNICNIFHVCITREDKIIDQPFICPFPTVFKNDSSGKSYCAQPESDDCKGKAFYRSPEGSTMAETDNNSSVLSYRLLENTLTKNECLQPGLYADRFYCNAYHKCTHDGQDQQYLCENQLLFNPESNICDYPINVICGGKTILRRPTDSSNSTVNQTNSLLIFGIELKPECLTEGSDGMIADKYYCNIYYNCRSGRASVNICYEGTVFDSIDSCREEESVDCGNRLILTSNGKRLPKKNKNIAMGRNFHTINFDPMLLPPPMENQKVVVNVPFDCKGRLDGHWRDLRYCDVFHACLAGEQRRSYGCTQVGERFYFDDASQKCEFAAQNPNGCSLNQYFTAIEPVPVVPGSQLTTMAPTEPWKIFIQSREQFSCSGKQDGFYASRWCNVFYRCFTGIATSFLCPKMPNGQRLWWVQHGSPQGMPQETAACTWPCETGRRCSSSGGIIIDSGSTIGESQQEAESVFSQSVCTSSSSSGSSSGSGSFNPQPSNTGGSSSGSSFYPQPSNTGGSSNGGALNPRPSNTGGSSSGGAFNPRPSNTGGSSSGTGIYYSSSGSSSGSGSFTSGGAAGIFEGFSVDSDVSCSGQTDGTFVGSRYCNVFHRCVSGTRRDFQCPRATNTPYDLWWNQQIQQCDWPCRVQCAGSVYGTSTPAQQVRAENALLFSNECASYLMATNAGILNNPAIAYSSGSSFNTNFQSRAIENPDLNYICLQAGKFQSRRYCNVYYECAEAGSTPAQAYECVDSFFDRSQGVCASKGNIPCLGGIYPYDSIPIDRNPDFLECSVNSGFQLLPSKQFCNIYYLCDGIQQKPTTFRCFDRQTQEDGIYDPFAERCDSKRNFNCQNAMLNLNNLQYRSLSIDHTRFVDLSILPCKYDQSYLVEHEQYCNLYHVCKQGDYQLVACLADVEDNQPTSYFYQPNGQCAAPISTLCPKTKGVFSYSRLLSSGNEAVFQPYVMAQEQDQEQQQQNFGSMPVQERVEPVPKCRADDNYIIPHERYCNLFYGCKDGELILYACVNRLTNTYGGVFQSSTGNCISSKECPTNEFFQPNQITTTIRPNTNPELRSYTLLEASNGTRKSNETFSVKSSFICENRTDGYYESEWCNVFYRCSNGKRIDERCPLAGSHSSSSYDLWWGHQNTHYNISNPRYLPGFDHIVRCEWPCRIQCKKSIWISKDNTHGDSDQILKQDHEYRPTCSIDMNRRKEYLRKISQQMIMYSDIPNPSNYTCPENIHGTRIRLPDTQYCNVFYECTNSKLVGSYFCIESQYDAKEKDCISLTINNNCPPERRFTFARSRSASQTTVTAYYEAVEVRSINPSGYECITDGIHTDPMFCNLFHACSGRARRTFQCRQTGTDGINDGISTFDLNTKSCTRFSTYSCHTLLYNHEFLILPVMFKPPTVSPCGREGFFPVSDTTAQYCNMFAWCPKGHGEAKVFECVSTTTNSQIGAFDIARRSCTSRATCPRARHSPSYNTSILALTLKPRIVTIGNRKQFSLTSTMLENGYIALGSDFQTTFTCPTGQAGFYSNPNYCDVFHYCYETGEVSSFVCASMPNRYQLWWSHQNEQGRSDNVYCDWPCNLHGIYSCPADKTVFMRDRQSVGNIPQREVIDATCSSAQVPTISGVINNVTPEPIQILTPPIYPPPSSNVIINNNNNMNNINSIPSPDMQAGAGLSSSILGYKPCIVSNEWYVSQPTIRCSPSFSATGYAPDPKDCSKYYACESFIGPDGMSEGILMQCLAGLWWDQQRRICVLPAEVACNPYNIINSQGQSGMADSSVNVNYQAVAPSVPSYPNGNAPPIPNIPPIPLNNIPTAPINNIPVVPNNNIPSIPVNSMPTAPINNVPVVPNNNIPDITMNNVPPMPSNNFPNAPNNNNFPNAPNNNNFPNVPNNNNFPNAPNNNFPNAPNNNFPNVPISNFPTAPINNFATFSTPIANNFPSFPTQPPVQNGAAQGRKQCKNGPLCVDVGLNILQQMKAIPGRPGWFYKCDSQCALEMRCPDGLIFDDTYQRCEWPSTTVRTNFQRLGSLKRFNDEKRKQNNKFRSMTVQQQKASRVSSNKQNKILEP